MMEDYRLAEASLVLPCGHAAPVKHLVALTATPAQEAEELREALGEILEHLVCRVCER